MPFRGDTVDIPVRFEIRFLSKDRARAIDNLTSGERAVQEAVVFNDDARPYSFDLTTSSKHPGLVYPDRAPNDRATFSGIAGFYRKRNWNSEPLYESVLYDGADRTQPESVEILKKIVVGDSSESAGSSIDLPSHFVVCSPRPL